MNRLAALMKTTHAGMIACYPTEMTLGAHPDTYYWHDYAARTGALLLARRGEASRSTGRRALLALLWGRRDRARRSRLRRDDPEMAVSHWFSRHLRCARGELVDASSRHHAAHEVSHGEFFTNPLMAPIATLLARAHERGERAPSAVPRGQRLRPATRR